MQSFKSISRLSKFGFYLLFLCGSASIFSQSTISGGERYRTSTDSLYQYYTEFVQADSSKNLAFAHLKRAEYLGSIKEDGVLREKYKHLDFNFEISNTLRKALLADNKNRLTAGIQEAMATNTIELSQRAFQAMQNSVLYKSSSDAQEAVLLFDRCLEDYKNTGSSQGLVDDFWQSENQDWRWIHFYRAVSLRLAAENEKASKEYQKLLAQKWQQAVLYHEYGNFLLSQGKAEEAAKIWESGLELFPKNSKLAVSLVQFYLQQDQLKKAQKVLAKFESEVPYQPELAISKALWYEKKGNIKKSDALFKAVFQSDKNEVYINRYYANYLLRRANLSDPSDAGEFAQQAYNLLLRASDLSPSNSELVSLAAEVKSKYPKVYREEENP